MARLVYCIYTGTWRNRSSYRGQTGDSTSWRGKRDSRSLTDFTRQTMGYYTIRTPSLSITEQTNQSEPQNFFLLPIFWHHGTRNFHRRNFTWTGHQFVFFCTQPQNLLHQCINFPPLCIIQWHFHRYSIIRSDEMIDTYTETSRKGSRRKRYKRIESQKPRPTLIKQVLL